jgi:WD40 repeat protein
MFSASSIFGILNFGSMAKVPMKLFSFVKGHGSPVIGVAWSHGENLLASSDSDGTVIVWKRA